MVGPVIEGDPTPPDPPLPTPLLSQMTGKSEDLVLFGLLTPAPPAFCHAIVYELHRAHRNPGAHPLVSCHDSMECRAPPIPLVAFARTAPSGLNPARLNTATQSFCP
jgi:hypothetical protein